MDFSDDVILGLRTWLEQQLDHATSLPSLKDGLIDEVVLRLLVADASQAIESPYGYARTILKNLVRDRIRKLERMQRAIEALGRERLADAKESGENSDVEDGELVRYLLEKSPLTPLQERVIRMMYFEGRTVGEVAEALSRNPGTIHQHHDRAIRKLAAQAACLGVAP